MFVLMAKGREAAVAEFNRLADEKISEISELFPVWKKTVEDFQEQQIANFSFSTKRWGDLLLIKSGGSFGTVEQAFPLSNVKSISFAEGKPVTEAGYCALRGMPEDEQGRYVSLDNYNSAKHEIVLRWRGPLRPSQKIFRDTDSSDIGLGRTELQRNMGGCPTYALPDRIILTGVGTFYQPYGRGRECFDQILAESALQFIEKLK